MNTTILLNSRLQDINFYIFAIENIEQYLVILNSEGTITQEQLILELGRLLDMLIEVSDVEAEKVYKLKERISIWRKSL
jgi:hypothetical protein